ncbi:MAG: UPF0280 family protein [Desulfobacteraceae bacterium]|jgi:hypothetical protein
MFDNRDSYRRCVERKGLTSFIVTACQTNLQILANRNLTAQATDSLLMYRGYLETYIQDHPEFATTLSPFPIQGPAPKIIRDMVAATALAGVGPMASVAGAISEYVGHDLSELSDEVIIENGGDTYIKVKEPLTMAIAAGNSPLSMKVGLFFNRTDQPFSVCTSSGTVGHSLSFGRADAVCIVADSAILADAAATAVGNRVKTGRDIDRAIRFGKSIEGIQGIVIIAGKEMGLWGDVELVKLTKKA